MYNFCGSVIAIISVKSTVYVKLTSNVIPTKNVCVSWEKKKTHLAEVNAPVCRQATVAKHLLK